MQNFKLHVGCTDKKGNVINLSECYKAVEDVMANSDIICYSVQEIKGYWKGVSETTLVVEHINVIENPNMAVEWEVIGNKLCQMLDQESVLLSCSDVTVKFV